MRAGNIIRCAKCGKWYDYDRYEGICPKCARYNRPDSRAEMEQEFHDRYDSDPDAHRRRRAGRAKAAAGNKKQRRVVLAVVLVLVIIGVAVGAGAAIYRIGPMQNVLAGNAGFRSLSVPYAWAECLGGDLSETDWEQTSVIVSAQEAKELAGLPYREGYVYYIVSLNVENKRLPDYDMTVTVPEDIRFWLQDGDSYAGQVDCLKVFEPVIKEAERNGSAYIDCLIQVPEEAKELYGTCTFHDANSSIAVFDTYLYAD